MEVCQERNRRQRADRQLCGAKDVASNEVFQLFYRAGLPPAVIARKVKIGTRSVFKYIAIAKSRMMVHAFGIDGLWRYMPRIITEQELEQMDNRELGYHLYWLGFKRAEIADLLGVPKYSVDDWVVGWKTGKVASMRNNSNAKMTDPAKQHKCNPDGSETNNSFDGQ